MAERNADAALAACVMAVDPIAIGGVSVRSRPGPECDQFLALTRAMMAPERPFRRLPLNIADARLLGGLDLAATLQAGRPILERGLLAEADGGILIAPMAERLPKSLAARLTAALDTGEVFVERDGFGTRSAAQFALVLLDEGMNNDERPPQALLDRLAIHLDFTLGDGGSFDPPFSSGQVEEARQTIGAVRANDEILRALCSVAAAYGIAASRAPALALKVARAHAALAGRTDVIDEDAVVAARLVLLPRATTLPVSETEESENDEVEDREQPEAADSDQSNADDSDMADRGPLSDIVLDAVAASIPAGLLEKLQLAAAGRVHSKPSGRAGALQQSAVRGRPIGSRRGDIKSGVRLNLVDTLRSAAPWQSLRPRKSGNCVAVRREDFRITRYKHRSETATIFVVDASGSSALHRLAEAKGAIELLLADCYVRRDQVALIAFRNKSAELILPPTRSLARAKRTLAALPGGGGTPLAAAIDAGHALADALRRKSISPTLVFLTDGRANVGRGGLGGRERALEDAYAGARVCRGARLPAVVVDTSPQPGPAACRLAAEIGGRYIPLPYADAATISRAVKSATPANDPVVN